MNKSLYRIVFNQSRGQLMAVAETAGAQGKAASGQTQGGDSSGAGPLKLAFRTLSLCIAVTFGVFVASPSQAQSPNQSRPHSPQSPATGHPANRQRHYPGQHCHPQRRGREP